MLEECLSLEKKELIVVINSNKQNISVGEVNNKTNDYFDNELLLKQIDLNEEIVRTFYQKE